ERTDVLIKYFFLAVVSVQCNVDAVVLCGLVSKCRQSLRAGNLILHTQTGTKLSATGRKLDDAIGFCFVESLQLCVDARRSGVVDCRERKDIDRKSTRLN